MNQIEKTFIYADLENMILKIWYWIRL